MLSPSTNVLSRADLDTSFADTQKPKGTDFANLIASGLNQKDDGIIKNSGSALAIEAENAAGGPVLELWNEFSNENADWVLQINPNNDSTKLGFAVADGTSGMARFYIDKATGNTGIGTVSPSALLTLRLPAASPPSPLLIQDSTGNGQLLAVDTSGNLTAAGMVTGASGTLGQLVLGGAAAPAAGVALAVKGYASVGDGTVYNNNLGASGTNYLQTIASVNAPVRIQVMNANTGSSATAELRATTSGGSGADFGWCADGSGNFRVYDFKHSTNRLYLNSSGNLSLVGAMKIGSSAAPGTGLALDVTGDISISGVATLGSVTNLKVTGTDFNYISSTLSIGKTTAPLTGTLIGDLKLDVFGNFGCSQLYANGTGLNYVSGSFAVGKSSVASGVALDVSGKVAASGALAVGGATMPASGLSVTGPIAASGALSAGATSAPANYGVSSTATTQNIACWIFAKGNNNNNASIQVDANLSDAFLHARTTTSSYALRAVGGGNTNRCSIYDLNAGQDRLMIDNAGGVRIPGALEVDGTLRVGGSSNLAGIRRILVAAVSQSGSTYTLKSSSYGFQSTLSRTQDGNGVHVTLTVASGITLDASNTLCLVSLCDNGSGKTGNIYDNSISCAFSATAGTVTVTLWSNSVSQTKMADGSGSQDDFSAVTAVGAYEDSPFSLMVIQLG